MIFEKISLKELRRKLNDECKCVQRKSQGSVMQFPQISHRIKRSLKIKKGYLNYLGGDILLSTIYRGLETNTKVYKLSGCAKLVHSTTMFL